MKLLLPLLLVVCISCKHEQTFQVDNSSSYQAISPLGDTLVSPAPHAALLARLLEAESSYLNHPENIDSVIWYGRFIAYSGEFQKAISFYSDAIHKWPEEPRLYRHRGHRYLTIRKYDLAIDDFLKAETLIQNTADQIEPDGMPNAQNKPVSSLHTNIWYHLGLAYYLTDQYDMALSALQKGLDASQNDDMRVAFIHWIYMIFRERGFKNEAQESLSIILPEMDVIESFEYHRLCQLYKGLVEMGDISIDSANSTAGSSAALLYGLANYTDYELADRLKAITSMKKIISRPDWGSFGMMAAEKQLVNWTQH